MLRPLLAALAAVALPASAAAETPKPAAPLPPQAVTIAFAPPLDTPLAFRVTKTRWRSDQPGRPVFSWLEQLRFSRAGAGYVMEWRILKASLPKTLDPQMQAMLAPWTETPVAFDVSAEGTIGAIRDWDKVKQRLQASIEGLTAMLQAKAADAAERQVTETIVRRTLDQFLGLSAEQAGTVMLANLRPAFGWGGSQFVEDAPRTIDSEEMLPQFGVPVRQRTTLSLVSVDPGRIATVELKGTTDPESFRTVLKALLARVEDLADEQKKAQARAGIEAMRDMTIAQEAEMLFDLPTGLPLRFSGAKTLSAGGKSGGERIEIAWQR